MNGENEYVTWRYMREHEQRAEENVLHVNTLQSEVRHLKEWKKDMDETLSAFIREQRSNHVENQQAITEAADKLSDRMTKSEKKQERMFGIGLAVWGGITLLIAISTLLTAILKHGG